MHPPSRQKAPMRDDLGDRYPPHNKRRRVWNDNTTQDEAAEHILANHYTISRDGTSLESSKEEKLRALQSAEDSAQNEEQSHIQHGEQEVATGGTQYHGFTFSGNANSTSPPTTWRKQQQSSNSSAHLRIRPRTQASILLTALGTKYQRVRQTNLIL